MATAESSVGVVVAPPPRAASGALVALAPSSTPSKRRDDSRRASRPGSRAGSSRPRGAARRLRARRAGSPGGLGRCTRAHVGAAPADKGAEAGEVVEDGAHLGARREKDESTTGGDADRGRASGSSYLAEHRSSARPRARARRGRRRCSWGRARPRRSTRALRPPTAAMEGFAEVEASRATQRETLQNWTHAAQRLQAVEPRPLRRRRIAPWRAARRAAKRRVVSREEAAHDVLARPPEPEEMVGRPSLRHRSRRRRRRAVREPVGRGPRETALDRELVVDGDVVQLKKLQLAVAS